MGYEEDRASQVRKRKGNIQSRTKINKCAKRTHKILEHYEKAKFTNYEDTKRMISCQKVWKTFLVNGKKVSYMGVEMYVNAY